MLIYEPKKYPDLNLSIGDIVYDYLTGEELGKVVEVTKNYYSYSDNISKVIYEFHRNGLHHQISSIYAEDEVVTHSNDILLIYLININDRIKC
jgi:hypothetical protein